MKTINKMMLAGCFAIVPPSFAVYADSPVAVRELGPDEITSEKFIEVLKPTRPVLRKRSVQMVTDASPCAGHRTRGIDLVASNAAPVADVAAMKVEFAFNSSDLTAETKKSLSELGKALQSSDLRSYCFQIEGHTDAVGSDDYNASLSRRRAQSVVNFLSRELGVEADRLVAAGRGEGQPIADNDSENGRQRNRRVQIVNLGSAIGG